MKNNMFFKIVIITLDIVIKSKNISDGRVLEMGNIENARESN